MMKRAACALLLGSAIAAGCGSSEPMPLDAGTIGNDAAASDAGSLTADSGERERDAGPVGRDAAAPDAAHAEPMLSFEAAPFDLAAGREDYRCTWFSADNAGGAAVKRFHPITSAGVHHVALFFAAGDTVQAERSCANFGSNWVLMAGSGVGSDDVVFPEGVALPLRSGGAYVLQVHMLNATQSPLQVKAGYDLGLTRPGESFARAGIYLTGSVRIQIPARAAGYAVDARCPATDLPQGASLVNVFPHMHKLGSRFLIERTAPSEAPETLLDSPWLFDAQTIAPIQPALLLRPQDQIHVRCTYNNPTSAVVRFGESTNDEMCFAVFYYQPATRDQIDCIR